MNKEKRKGSAPSHTAALITALVLGACGGLCLLLFMLTAYIPLLLSGILQLLPAVLNLLLMIPRSGRRVPPEGESAQSQSEVQDKPKAKGIKRLLRAVVSLPKRGVEALKRLWREGDYKTVPVLLFAVIVGFNAYFWSSVRGGALPYAAEYYLPVALVVLFVLFIVLDKWCKHAGGRSATEEECESHHECDDPYHRALLHSLRGALAVARLAFVIMTITLMIGILGLADLVTLTIVAVSLLFVYETLFVIVSLCVRVIRREMDTAPELSIPMFGLGGEDLSVISYLEKNTGITMRSLWSIRLIKYVLPYTAMAIVLLLWGFSGVVKIEAHQQGAHYRLGRLQEETLEPGIHLTLPWPFDSVEVYNTEVSNSMTIGYLSNQSTDNIWTQAHGSEEYKLLLGGGSELVSINLRLVYRIGDLKAYLANNATPELLMQATAYEIVTDKTIQTDLHSLLSVDRTVFATELKAELIERLAPYGTGIEVQDVVLESIHPPVDIADVYQRMVGAKAEAEQMRVAAASLAELIRIDAESKKYQIVGAAQREKASAIADAELDNAAFEAFVEAKKSWDEVSKTEKDDYTYEYFRYLQAIAAAYGSGDCQVVIVGDGVNSSNIYIGSVPLGGN